MPKILLARGHLVNPWEFGPWAALPDSYQVSYLLTRSNRFELPDTRLTPLKALTLRDGLPRGRFGDVVAYVLGDRYWGIERALAAADVVHVEELSFWFSAEIARRRANYGFKLVVTVWETLPLLATLRTYRARRYRQAVLEAADLFLAATRRAADALMLEGVSPARIRVCAPGIDTERFSSAALATSPERHVILSPGRLVWEKGHQDVLRAVAAIKHGIVKAPVHRLPLEVWIIGAGPEEERIKSYAQELGLGSEVRVRSLKYEEMPNAFAQASAVVLASQPWAGAPLYTLGRPHAFWEEQFGLVLAEGIASGVDIVATTTGAIPEVLEGTGATLVPPGDWIAIAQALARGPLSRPPGTRVSYDPEIVASLSNQAAANRLAGAYSSML